MNTQDDERRQLLKSVAEAYFRGLQQQDFASIPYDENVTLRAPLSPGGVNRPLVGESVLRTQWWQPLVPALPGLQVRILDHYINEPSTAIVTEAEITITVLDPPVTLRVADRFTVSDEGKILEQENHFDPRDVTNPGWQDA
ncbi:MAG: nuclear transport factor 2 family protein [Actinobacteria bacterium]|nr:nuclear transport factor 2 family protein [Actinomycetota bacterium]